MTDQISLFVPGRLCLFGEHSDWAGTHKRMNSDIQQGYAIVTGIHQGIYATAKKSNCFMLYFKNDSLKAQNFQCAMFVPELKSIANSGGYFSYVAGVASYMAEHYRVGGVEIEITDMSLPEKRGLSSSAAICVLVARAFNQLYNLQLSTLGEMDAAYRGEQRTPSRCGRLDQACAFGTKPVLMTFEGDEISVTRLTVKSEMNWVFADLMAKKDTIRILADLNKCYPFPRNDLERRVHEALGKDNEAIVKEAVKCIAVGDNKRLGELMTEAQRLFDEKVAPACPEELTSPALHKVLDDTCIKELTYGGKGVGSQGDGCVQFLAKDAQCQQQLCDYLFEKYGLDTFNFTIQPVRSVKKAIIPVAGFGTRLYPATRIMKKEFFPIVDTDGLAKPAIMVLLEELDSAGIEEIYLVIGEEDRKLYERFFYTPLLDEHYQKLSQKAQQYDARIQSIGKKLRYVVQEERLGFGHAVYLCKDFTDNEAVILLLGDTLYRSASGKSCTVQLLDAYEKTGKSTIGIHEIALRDVVNYGIASGKWESSEDGLLNIQEIVEKPSVGYAEEYLATVCKNGEERYYAPFGEYVLTPEVFERLAENIAEQKTVNSEYELTGVLDDVREKSGLFGFIIKGESYDIGIPSAYKETAANF